MLNMSRIDLILASSSPRRQDFFRALGLTFRTVSAEVDETPLPGELPRDLVARLAASKAKAVADRLAGEFVDADFPETVYAETVIVAADTTVALGDEILGKPEDGQEATAMLQRLRAREHQVHSAVAVRRLRAESASAIVFESAQLSENSLRVNTTTVLMRDYSLAEVAEYVASGDPLDKAGAYALQHPQFAPAAGLSGCVAGVVGLPLKDLVEMLQVYGIDVPCAVAPICEAQAAFPCCTRQ